MEAIASYIGGGIIGGISLSAIMVLMAVVNYALGYISGIAVFLGGNLVNWALNLNTAVVQSQTVQIGWVIVRDIANLGFVLAIILIAFITILRLETFQTKQMLTKLIIAALLVNFSLVIAGVFIDFAGILTDFFINASTGGGGVANFEKIGSGLANAFQVQRFLQVPEDPGKVLKLVAGSAGLGLLSFVASIFFVTIFTVIAAMTLFSLFAMLLIRYMVLNVLLILAPLAWLMWIWPQTSGHWQRWWSEFFKWVFFAPSLSFFIYLALKLAETNPTGATTYSLGSAKSLFNLDQIGISIADVGGIVGQMVAIVGLLFVGMKVSLDASMIGADAALKYTGMAKDWAIGKTTAAPRRALVGGGAKLVEGALGSRPMQGLSSFLMKSRLTRDVGRGIKGLAAQARAGFTTEEDYKKFQQDYSNKQIYNDEDLLTQAKLVSGPLGNPAEQSAIAVELAKRGLTSKLESQKGGGVALEKLIKTAQDTGHGKDIMDTRPDLARFIGKEPKEILSKITDPLKIAPEALEKSEIFADLDKNTIKRIASRGTPKQRAALISGWAATQDKIESLRKLSETGSGAEEKSRAKREYAALGKKLETITPELISNTGMHEYITDERLATLAEIEKTVETSGKIAEDEEDDEEEERVEGK